MRQLIQQEVKVNKRTRKRVFCVCQEGCVFDLTLSPILLLICPLIVWHCDLYQSLSCVMFRCLEQ